MKARSWALVGLAGAGLLALAANAQTESEPATPSTGPGTEPEPAQPDPAPPPTEKPPKLRPMGDTTVYKQPEIIAALWQVAKSGETGRFDEIKRWGPQMTPELQVYLVSAAKYLIDAYAQDAKFRQEFASQFDEINKKYDEYNNAVDSGLGAAAAAVNAIPGYGQILSAALLIAIAIRRAVIAGSSLENRKLSDNEHIFRDWEGSDCLRGLRIEGNTNPSAANLRAKINSDLIASRLPFVEKAYKFEFTPTWEQFRETARKAGLYGEEYLKLAYGFKSVWNLQPGDDFPTTALEIINYGTGYTVAINGGEYSNNFKWGKIGVLDAKAGRAMRMSDELQIWASNYADSSTAKPPRNRGERL